MGPAATFAISLLVNAVLAAIITVGMVLVGEEKPVWAMYLATFALLVLWTIIQGRIAEWLHRRERNYD